MFDKDYAINLALEALKSCKATQTRDGYGYPYTHYEFDELKINKALHVLTTLTEKNGVQN